MSSTLQTVIALALVAFATGWLVWRSFLRKKQPGCGGDCGCPASEVKISAARLPRSQE